MSESVFLSNLHYFCAQTDGAYKFPNSAEGDLLKRAKIEVEALQRDNAALRKDAEILDWMNGNIEAIMFKRQPDGFVWDVRNIVRGAMPKEVKS